MYLRRKKVDILEIRVFFLPVEYDGADNYHDDLRQQWYTPQ